MGLPFRLRAPDFARAGCILLVAAVFVPPLEVVARRYVVFESLRFALIALVLPVLLLVAWPTLRSNNPHRVERLFPLHEMQRPSFTGIRAVLPAVACYLGALVFWQLPGTVDALAHRPGLVVVEVATFVAVGSWYWSGLVATSPERTGVHRIGRVLLAAVPMWTVWVLAYLIGFAHSGWFPAYRHDATVISTLADQQFAVGVLWFISASVFLPTIFSNFIRLLSEDEQRAGGRSPSEPTGPSRVP